MTPVNTVPITVFANTKNRGLPKKMKARRIATGFYLQDWVISCPILSVRDFRIELVATTHVFHTVVFFCSLCIVETIYRPNQIACNPTDPLKGNRA